MEWVQRCSYLTAYPGVPAVAGSAVEQYKIDMFFVYAIYNYKAGKLYIGQTYDLDDRLRKHNDHLLKGYTSRFQGEWKLIYSESVPTRSEALLREKPLKSHQGREYLKQHLS